MRSYVTNLAAYYHAHKTPRRIRRVAAVLARLRAGVIDRDRAIRQLTDAVLNPCGGRVLPFSDLPLESDYHGTRPNVPASNW